MVLSAWTASFYLKRFFCVETHELIQSAQGLNLAEPIPKFDVAHPSREKVQESALHWASEHPYELVRTLAQVQQIRLPVHQ
jgi:hypothetical protein